MDRITLKLIISRLQAQTERSRGYGAEDIPALAVLGLFVIADELQTLNEGLPMAGKGY